MRSLAELNEKEQKRFDIYKRRADEAQSNAMKLEKDIRGLERHINELNNPMNFSEDGLENFQQAMTLQSEAMDTALALDPETPEIIQQKFESVTKRNGKPIKFCVNDEQDNFIMCFIRYSFNLVSDFYQKAKRSIAIKEQFHGFPEPLKQMENNLTAMQDAVSETLTELGIADQRPDVGKKNEKGDPPPVLELVFTRAAQKARQLNQELVNALGMNGPSR